VPPHFLRMRLLRMRLSCVACPGSHTHYLLLAHVLSSCCTARQPPPLRQLPPRRRLSRFRQLPRVDYRVPVNFARVAVACVTSLGHRGSSISAVSSTYGSISPLVSSRAVHRNASAKSSGRFSTPLRSGRVNLTTRHTLVLGARRCHSQDL
jgi:hypothetical protein